jgi:hypothetical protein
MDEYIGPSGHSLLVSQSPASDPAAVVESAGAAAGDRGTKRAATDSGNVDDEGPEGKRARVGEGEAVAGSQGPPVCNVWRCSVLCAPGSALCSHHLGQSEEGAAGKAHQVGQSEGGVSRRCRVNNGKQGWRCPEMCVPGTSMCALHLSKRPATRGVGKNNQSTERRQTRGKGSSVKGDAAPKNVVVGDRVTIRNVKEQCSPLTDQIIAAHRATLNSAQQQQSAGNGRDGIPTLPNAPPSVIGTGMLGLGNDEDESLQAPGVVTVGEESGWWTVELDGGLGSVQCRAENFVDKGRGGDEDDEMYEDEEEGGREQAGGRTGDGGSTSSRRAAANKYRGFRECGECGFFHHWKAKCRRQDPAFALLYGFPHLT